MVEFKKDFKMKPKIYPSNCVIKGNNWQVIIVITYDKYTFSINNSIRKVWTRIEILFYNLKVVNKASWLQIFILFGQLNLAFLNLDKRDKVV